MVAEIWVSKVHADVVLMLPQDYPGDTYLCALGAAIVPLREYGEKEWMTLLDQQRKKLTPEERSEYFDLVMKGRRGRVLKSEGHP